MTFSIPDGAATSKMSSRFFARKLGVNTFRAIALVLGAGLVPLIVGCSEVHQRLQQKMQLQQRMPGPEPLAAAPTDNDPALTYRNWQPTSGLYKSDMVIAGPTYKVLEPKPGNPARSTFREPALFLANIVYMPVSMIEELAANGVRYKSLSTPPTFTDMPPLVRQPAEGEPGVPVITPLTPAMPTTTFTVEPSTNPDSPITRPSGVQESPATLSSN
jgi:hypothetical protein